MQSEAVILEKIEHLSETVRQQWDGIKSQSDDISKIKKTVELIAVQSTRIGNLSGQINELWQQKKGIDTKISDIEKFQASCPRDQNQKDQAKLEKRVNETMQRQWLLISLLAVSVIGIFWKVS